MIKLLTGFSFKDREFVDKSLLNAEFWKLWEAYCKNCTPFSSSRSDYRAEISNSEIKQLHHNNINLKTPSLVPGKTWQLFFCCRWHFRNRKLSKKVHVSKQQRGEKFDMMKSAGFKMSAEPALGSCRQAWWSRTEVLPTPTSTRYQQNEVGTVFQQCSWGAVYQVKMLLNLFVKLRSGIKQHR